MARFVPSSYFQAEFREPDFSLEDGRYLTLWTASNGVPLTDRVLSWPTIRTQWDQVRATKLNVNLANDDGGLNFILDDLLNLTSTCEFGIGVFNPGPFSYEWYVPFKGKITGVKYSKGEVTLSLEDKFGDFSKRAIGTNDAPMSYTTSNYLPSDIAWWVCTSFGGLSAIQSDSNPDIDWPSFQAWAEVFSADGVFINAVFKGLKVTEALSRIGKLTQSAIYPENDLLIFSRFTTPSSYSETFDDDTAFKTNVEVVANEYTNKQHVFFDYDVNSRYHKGTVTVVDTASVNSYGLSTNISRDNTMWYINSGSAYNLGARILLTRKEPFARVDVDVPLYGMLTHIGDTILISDTQIGMELQASRVMSKSFNMDSGVVTLKTDPTQILGNFILDVSTLAGPDILL